MNARKVEVRKIGAWVWEWRATVWIDADTARPLPVAYSGHAATRKAAMRRGTRFAQRWERRHDDSAWIEVVS